MVEKPKKSKVRSALFHHCQNTLRLEGRDLTTEGQTTGNWGHGQPECHMMPPTHHVLPTPDSNPEPISAASPVTGVQGEDGAKHHTRSCPGTPRPGDVLDSCPVSCTSGS